MSILKALSFTNTSTTYLALELATVTAGSAIVGSGGRFAGDSLRLATAGDGNTYIVGNALPTSVDLAVHFARKTAAFNATEIAWRWQDGGSDQVELKVSTSGQLQVTRNGTLLGDSGATLLALNTYYSIGFRVKFDNSTGTVDVWVDTANVIHLTGQDTQATANASANGWKLQGNSNGTMYSDVVIFDTSGSDNNNYTGFECRCDESLPDTDAGPNDGTPSSGSDHADMVDEATPDGDATYNDMVDTNRELYNMAAVSGLTGTILGFEQKAIVRKTDAGSVRIKHVAKSSSTVDLSAAQSVASGYLVLCRVVEQDPNTSAAYASWSALNGTKQGIDVLIP